MKTICESRDLNLIKAILSVPGVYDNLVYDGSPSLPNFVPDFRSSVWFILYDNSEITGLIKVDKLNSTLCYPHIFIFEKHRGPESVEWGKQVVKYMKEQYSATKAIALTPYNTAKRYAEKIGFQYIKVISKSLKKHGKLLDQYLLEMEL